MSPTLIFIQILTYIYSVVGDLGWSIVVFTLLTRLVLLPLTIPSLKAQQKIKELAPELNKLKKNHKGDSKSLQAKQMEMYKKYNVNPLAGCLPQIVQLVIVIFLYRALIKYLGDMASIDTSFLWLNLSHPDPIYVLPVVTAVSQLILSLMIAPATETRDVVPNDKKHKEENKKEEDMAEMAQTMQQQMIFLMPVMTGFIALSLPSGIAVYWLATTVFSIIQQYYISGWGGIPVYYQRALQLLSNYKEKKS